MSLVNRADLAWSETSRGDATFRRKQLGEAAGSERLGVSLYELPPGERSWPYHYHTANEEAVYVLAGTGLFRGADGERAIEAGDYLALPTGESGGHRLVNDGDEPLRYLMISTMREPDVTIYPEMGKFGVFVGSPPGGRDERRFHGFYRTEADVPYWE